MKSQSLFLLLLSPCMLLAAASGGVDEWRQLRMQRAQIEQTYQQALRECADRFAVNACQQRAREVQQAALLPLQQREYELNAAEREARARTQRERVQAREREFAERAARAVLAPAAPAAVASAPNGRASAVEAFEAQSQQRVRRSMALSEQAFKEAAAKRQALQQRELAAREHREAVLRRNEERLARKPAAAGLPVPAASAASR